jgi:hypothetical protein
VAEDTIRKKVSREVKRALSDARLSARAAAKRMDVEPKTIYRWINEENDASLENLVLFAKHVGPIRLDIGDTTKKPPLAERLDAKMDIALWGLRISPEEQADLLVRRARGEAWPPRASDGEPHEGGGQSASAPSGPSSPLDQ